MKLRRHQRELENICQEILDGRNLTDIVCAVTPGGGKSLLPQILATRLIPAITDALCWIVPRSVLQDQGARGFQNPSHRAFGAPVGGHDDHQSSQSDEGLCRLRDHLSGSSSRHPEGERQRVSP